MKRTETIIVIAGILIAAEFLVQCGEPADLLGKVEDRVAEAQGGESYTVSYKANEAESGSVPRDVNSYKEGKEVTVLGNPGGLLKGGHSFNGWNTTSHGTGQSYTQGQTFEMGSADVVLWAKWTANPTYRVIYKGNEATGGDVPEDTTNYEEGQTVTVLGNSGGLTKDDGSFSGWNLAADGSDTDYSADDTFVMGVADVELHAQWMPVWIKSYGSNSGNETLQSLFHTDDGGFVGVGTTDAGSGGGTDIYVFKVDEAGEYVWQYSYGESQDDDTVGGGLLPNGNIAVVANTTISGRGQEIRVLCLKPDGTIEWQKRYGETNMDYDQYATDIDITPTGDIIICGAAWNPEQSTGSFDYMVMKVSGTGTKEWVKRKDGGEGDDEYEAIQTANDGSVYLIAGYGLTKKSAAGEDLDQENRLCQFHSYIADSIGNDGLLSIGEDSLIGGDSSRLYISKSGYDGAKIWSFYFGGSDEEIGIDLTQYSDGTIVVAGTTTYNASTEKDLLIVKFTGEGDLVKQRTYPLDGIQNISAIDVTDDGGLIIGGTTPFATASNIVLFRIDQEMKPCVEQIEYEPWEPSGPIICGGGSGGPYFPMQYEEYTDELVDTSLNSASQSFLKNDIE